MVCTIWAYFSYAIMDLFNVTSMLQKLEFLLDKCILSCIGF